MASAKQLANRKRFAAMVRKKAGRKKASQKKK